MKGFLKISGALLSSFLLFGCLDTDDRVEVGEARPILAETGLTITTIQTNEAVEVQEQVARTFVAEVEAVADGGTVPATVTWQLLDAPEGFEVSIEGGELEGITSQIQLTSPDIDGDVSATLRVSAVIDETQEYEGAESFKDIPLLFTANGEVVISGAVVDRPIPFALVTIKVGDEIFTVTADAEGNYELPVEFANPDLVVEVTATGDPESDFSNVEFKSYLGSGSTLIADAGEDGELTAEENININVSNVTTAVFVLVQEVIEEQGQDGTPTEPVALQQEQLEQLVEQIDTQEVIEVAAVIQLVVDYGAPLPEGTETVLDLVTDLVADEEAKDQFVEESIETVVANNEEIDNLSLDNLIEDIVADPNLVPSAEETQFEGAFYAANTVNSVSSQFVQDDLLFGKITLDIVAESETNTGMVDNFLVAGDRTFSWVVEGTQAQVTFDAALTLPNELYGVPDGALLLISGFSINELADNNTNRSWLVRLQGEIRANNVSTPFETGSLAITATPAANIEAYTVAELTATPHYFTVVDNSSSVSSDSEALLNASSHRLHFTQDQENQTQSGEFVNAANETVAFTWDISEDGSVNVDVAASESTPAQSLSYARVKAVTDSTASYVVSSVALEGNEYSFSDLTFAVSATPELTGFEQIATYKIIGADETFTFLPDGTGFFYRPQLENEFNHFTYSLTNNGVSISLTSEGSRACVATSLSCENSQLIDLTYDNFVNERLTLHSSVSDLINNTVEGELAIAKTVRDEPLTAADIPSNWNLYLAEEDDVYSFFFNADGTGKLNSGSNDGLCQDITWAVSEGGRLEVVNGALTTTYKLLAGTPQRGVVWGEVAIVAELSSLFTTTSVVNECAGVEETFIPLTAEDITAGNYKVKNTETGEVTVVRFTDDGLGYLVDGKYYFDASVTEAVADSVNTFTWALNEEGRLLITEDHRVEALPSQITLKDGKFVDGLIQVRDDETQDGSYDSIFSVNIKYLRGCEQDFDGDAVSNCHDLDDDNDGTPDTEDALPLNPNETSDFDKDGLGDNEDPDDDNDGVEDVNDQDPFNPEIGAAIVFTEQLLPNQYVKLNKGRVAEPAVALGVGDGQVITFDKTNDTFKEVSDRGVKEFSYAFEGNLMKVTPSVSNEFDTWIYLSRLVEVGVTNQQIADQFVAEFAYDQIKVKVVESSYTLAMVEDGDLQDTFIRTASQSYYIINDYEREYLTGSVDSMAVDGTFESVSQYTDLSQINQISFTEQMVSGQTWALDANVDHNGYSLWADVITFSNVASGFTAQSLVTEQTYTWAIGIFGDLILTNDATGTKTEHRIFDQFESGYGIHTSAISANDEDMYASYSLSLQVDAAASVTPLLDQFAETGFAFTRESWWAGEELLPEESVFGFKLNSDKTGVNYNGSFDVNTSQGLRDRTWDYVDNTNTVGILATHKAGEGWYKNCDIQQQDCAAIRERFWKPLAVAGNRVYVLEWERWNDTEADFVNQPNWFINIPGRVNFYEVFDLTTHIDIDGDGTSNMLDPDIDGDGVPNDRDIDPYDATAMFDNDNDGIADSKDADDDNDGVLDVDDVAPFDPSVGKALTITSDVLAGELIAIPEGAIAEPDFGMRPWATEVINFNEANGEFTFSSYGEFERGTFELIDNMLVVNVNDEVERELTYLGELVEDGLFSYEQIDYVRQILDIESIQTLTTYQPPKLWLIEDTADSYTFWIEEVRQIEVVNTKVRELLTGDVNSSPLQMVRHDKLILSKVSSLPVIAFTQAELAGTDWALPLIGDMSTDNEWYRIQDEILSLASNNTFTNANSAATGTWSIDQFGNLVLVIGNDVVTITRHKEYTGAVAIRAKLSTTEQLRYEGKWTDGTDGYTMPVPSYTPAADEMVIFYAREDGVYDGIQLNVGNYGTCSGITNLPEESYGMSPDGFDNNFGKYWILKKSPEMECLEFAFYDSLRFDNSNWMTVFNAESESGAFYVTGADFFNLDVANHPTTYDSQALHQLVDVEYNSYQLAIKDSSAASIEVFRNTQVVHGLDLTNPYDYDEFGQLILDNLVIYDINQNGMFTRHYGQFDINNAYSNYQWQIVGDTLTWFRTVDTSTGTDNCSLSLATCEITIKRHWQAMQTVGDRVYGLESGEINRSYWDTGTYDPNAFEPWYKPRVVFYEKIDIAQFDQDGDLISDNVDPDIDGDGVNNENDAFPTDPNESNDNDMDGIGDNADLDDDNDGVEDSKDADPFDPEVGEALTISQSDIAESYILMREGRLTNPAINKLYRNGIRYEFSSALVNNQRSYTRIDDIAGYYEEGHWVVENNKIVISVTNAETYETSYNVYDLRDEGLLSQEQVDAYISYAGYEWISFVVTPLGGTMAMLENGAEIDSFYRTSMESLTPVHINENEILFGTSTPQALVRERSSWVQTLRDFSTVEMLSLTGPEIVGTRTVPGVPYYYEDGTLSRAASDILVFNSNGTGHSLTGFTPDFSWGTSTDQININYGNGDILSLTKLAQYDDSDLLLGSAVYGGVPFSRMDLSLVYDESATTNVLLDKFALASFALTDPDAFDFNGIIPQEVHGYRLQTGYTVKEIRSSADEFSYLEGSRDAFLSVENGVNVFTYTRNSNREYVKCDVNNIDCTARWKRFWKPVATIGNRVYVLEWRETNANSNSFDNSPESWYNSLPPRLNFYEVFDIPLDTDHDGIDDSVDEDIDNDGVLNGDDAMPYDFFEQLDTDNDGIGNNQDIDDDNDGVNDVDDALPLDPTEQSDHDMDGVGDIADLDDDNDGVNDDIDLAPYDATVSQALELTDINLATSYVTVNTGRLAEPDFRTQSVLGYQWNFEPNGVLRTVNYRGTSNYNWLLSNNEITVQIESPEISSYAENVWYLADIGVISNELAEQYVNNTGSELVEVNSYNSLEKYYLIEDTNRKDTFYIKEFYSFNFVADADKEFFLGSVTSSDVQVFTHGYTTQFIARGDINSISFSDADLAAGLAITGMPYDVNADGLVDELVADFVTFDLTNGTGQSSVLGHSFTWIRNGNALQLTFSEFGTVTLTQDQSYSESFAVLAEATFNSVEFSRYALGAVMDSQREITPLIDKVAMNSFSATDPNAYDQDGALIPTELFGFRLEATGAGKRLWNQDPNLLHSDNWREVSWYQENDIVNIVSKKTSWGNYENCDLMDASCTADTNRKWLPIKTVGERVYVLEWREKNMNHNDFSNAQESWYIQMVPRINFYQVQDIALDSDNDGILDSNDPDNDNDGVDDVNDAFPFDADIQFDSDSDGVADKYDAFPFDANEQFDNDLDGIGDNADLDDDNDGIPDDQDPTPFEDTRLVSELTWTDPALQQCVINQHGDSAIVGHITWLSCPEDVAAITDLQQLSKLSWLELRNVNDWSGLSTLSLTSMSFAPGNNFSDISLLHGMARLDDVRFLDMTLSDWSPLSQLSLTYLRFDSTNFDDLSLLTNMVQLKSLGIFDQPITDWSLLSQLNLQTAGFNGSNFSDLSLVSNLTELTSLYVQSTAVTDWSWLESMNLLRLSVAFTTFNDLAAIRHMSELVYLNLSGIQSDNFYKLSNFGALEEIRLNDTNFADLSFLNQSSHSLRELMINNSQVSYLEPLYNFYNLQTLWADSMSIPTSQAHVLAYIENYQNVYIASAPDTDANGFVDYIEYQTDTDGDGLNNLEDTDDDNDGHLDVDDAYPLDASQHLAINFNYVVEYTGELFSAFNGSSASWYEQFNDFVEGNSALQAGKILNNQHSTVDTTITTSTGGTLSFMWKVVSEYDFDFLTVLVNGQEYMSISGEVDWHRVAIYLEPGTHDVSWVYSKDGSVSHGADTGWLDDFIFSGELTQSDISLYDIVGEHVLYSVNDDSTPTQYIDRVVTFNANNTGSIDWGFGLDTFTWAVSGSQIIITYDNVTEVDRWTFYNVTTDAVSSAYFSSVINVETDPEGDGTYQLNSVLKYYSERPIVVN